MILNLFILIIVLFILLQTIHEPPVLTEVKKKYEILINHIKTSPAIPEKFKILENRILISGFNNNFEREIGYNINKGGEIGLCLDGNANQVFHVLIHELAHSTVEEYSHSKKFWNNFKELGNMCENLGIYKPIDKTNKFCGKYIKDN